MTITLADMRSFPVQGRRAGYCSRGARLFAKRYNLDWQDFIANGIDAEVLLATGDAQAIAVVEWKEIQLKAENYV